MRRFLLVICSFIINLSIANAEACKKKLTNEEFIAAALAKNSMLAEIDQDYAERLSQAFETEVLGNPELQIEHTATSMNIGGSNDAQSNVNIAQPIRLSDFGQKQRVASLIRNIGEVDKKRALLAAVQKLKYDYCALFAFQQRKKIIEQAEQKASAKVVLIKQGVSKGLFNLGEEKLFEGEKYRLQAQLKEIKANIAMQQAEISKTTGISCAVVAIGNLNLERIPPKDILIEKAKVSKISESNRIELLEELGAEQSQLANQNAFPQISPRLLYQHTNDGGDFFGAGISIPLPFWNRNQAEKIKSSAALNTFKTTRENYSIDSQLELARVSAIKFKERADIFSKKVIPSFKAALSSQEKTYAQGKGNVLEVWQTLTVYNEVQTQGLTLWLDAMLARIRLSILVGEEI